MHELDQGHTCPYILHGTYDFKDSDSRYDAHELECDRMRITSVGCTSSTSIEAGTNTKCGKRKRERTTNSYLIYINAQDTRVIIV